MARKRWIQCLKTGKLIPAELYHRQRTGPAAAVHDDLDPFISPVDGSVIGSNSQLREHNDRNNVIQHLEFGEGGVENLAAKKKREDFYQGKHGRGETLKRKMEIHEVINHLERQ